MYQNSAKYVYLSVSSSLLTWNCFMYPLVPFLQKSNTSLKRKQTVMSLFLRIKKYTSPAVDESSSPEQIPKH